MTIIATQTGELSDGLVFNGTIHKNFELRLTRNRGSAAGCCC